MACAWWVQKESTHQANGMSSLCGEAQMIEDTPLHEHQLPHPSSAKWLYDEPQGRSHKQPWQPVAISITIVAIIIGIILL